jgi:hypothetical protein
VRRRRFLAAAAGAGVLVAGSAGGLLALRGFAPAVRGLRCLTPQEYRTATAIATALFPPGGAFACGADSMDLGRAFDDFLADEDESRQTELKQALLLVEYGPLAYDHHAVTFSHLPADQRLAQLERWSTSDDLLRRRVALAFHKYFAIVFYDRAEVWSEIGYAL